MSHNYFGRYKTKVKKVCSGEYLVTQIDTEGVNPDITCMLENMSWSGGCDADAKWFVGQPTKEVTEYGQVRYDTIHCCGYPTKKDALKWLSREYVGWLED